MDRYIKSIHDMGIEEVKEICADSIEVAPWSKMKCQYGCSNYNTSWCCPPLTPGYKEMLEIIQSYKRAILFSTQDINIPGRIAKKMEKQLYLDGYYKALALGSGPCRLCADFKNCMEHKCRFPEEAIPSMEACGIDVFKTARNNGFVISTISSKEDTPHYFSMVLVE